MDARWFKSPIRIRFSVRKKTRKPAHQAVDRSTALFIGEFTLVDFTKKRPWTYLSFLSSELAGTTNDGNDKYVHGRFFTISVNVKSGQIRNDKMTGKRGSTAPMGRK